MMRRIGLAALSGMLWCSACDLHAKTARVDSGPVGTRVVARALVVPSAGVRHVYAPQAGTLTRINVREGERVEQAQRLAELDVAGRTEAVQAPERGVVLARHCELGDWAQKAEQGATQPLFELADPERIELRVEVEERDAAKLTPGLPVEISTRGAKATRARGQVVRVAARLARRNIDADDARLRADGLVRVVSVSLDAPAPNWPLGSHAEATIELDRREAATRVPRAALSVRDGRTVAFAPGLFGTHELAVEVVRVDDAYAEIRGLTHGIEVVLPR